MATAEKQIRAGLARLQVLSLGLLERIQTRAAVLARFLEQRVIVRTANKIREWTQKTIQRVKLLVNPFVEYLRGRLRLVAQGWRAIRDGAINAASGLRGVFEPALERVRRSITTLMTPFRAVRAYGTATFRILGDAGSRAFGRIRDAGQGVFTGVTQGLGRVRDGFRSADAAASAFSGRLGTLGGVARRVFIGLQEDVRTFGRVLATTGRGVDRFGQAMQRVGDRVSGTSRTSRVFGGVLSGVGGIISGVSGIARGFGSVLSGASTISGAFTGVLGNLGRGMKGLGGAALTAVGALAKFGAIGSVIGLVAGALTFAVGAVGAAFAGLPALIGAAVVSFAAFALGMDGIKRAYESSLKPALDQLKVQVSQVFEETLTPAFENLSRNLIPQVTDSMKRLAREFGVGAQEIVKMVTEGENVRKINDLINNTANEVRHQLVPALGNVIQSFINIGANADIMRDIVGIFTDLTDRTSEWLSAMERTGQAESALAALRTTLDKLVALFFRLLTGAVQFFEAAAPGFNRLLDSITPTESVMRTLGEAFGTAADAAADLLDSIPQSTWDAIADAAGRLADKLNEFANNPEVQAFFQGLLDTLPGLIDGFGKLVGAVEAVIGVFNDIAGAWQAVDGAMAALDDWLKKIPGGAEPATDALGEMPPAFEEVGTAAETGGRRVSDGFMSPIAGLAGQAGNALAPLPGAVEPPFTGAAVAAQVGAEEARAAAEQGFGAIPPAAEGALAPLPGLVAPPVDAAAAAVKTGADKAAADAAAGFAPIPPDAAATLEALAPAVQGAMDAAAQAADSGANAVRDSVQRGFDAAADAADSAMPRVSDAVESAMQAAGASAEVGGARIGDGIRAGADAAASAAEGAMPRVSDAVQSAMDAAAQAAEDGGRRIADGLRTSVDQAAASVQAGMTRITAVITAGMAQAVAATTQGGQQIQLVLRAALEQTVAVVEQSWQRIVAAFQEGGQRAVAIARQTGQQILATFRALAGPMYSAGFQIISRLAAGMIAAQGQAFAAAQATAAGIRARFPASPAKTGPLSGAGDPQRSGAVIMQRLAAGIVSAGAVVQAALAPILARLVAQMNQATVNPMVDAAREILDRIRSGGPIYEDLTWRGASANVGRYNDPLLDAMDRSGARDPRAFLEDFIRRNTPEAVSGGGGVLAELQTQTAVLVSLRGDLAGAGYGPDVLNRLDQLIVNTGGGGSGATAHAGAMRDLSEMGAFP